MRRAALRVPLCAASVNGASHAHFPTAADWTACVAAAGATAALSAGGLLGTGRSGLKSLQQRGPPAAQQHGAHSFDAGTCTGAGFGFGGAAGGAAAGGVEAAVDAFVLSKNAGSLRFCTRICCTFCSAVLGGEVTARAGATLTGTGALPRKLAPCCFSSANSEPCDCEQQHERVGTGHRGVSGRGGAQLESADGGWLRRGGGWLELDIAHAAKADKGQAVWLRLQAVSAAGRSSPSEPCCTAASTRCARGPTSWPQRPPQDWLCLCGSCVCIQREGRKRSICTPCVFFHSRESGTFISERMGSSDCMRRTKVRQAVAAHLERLRRRPRRPADQNLDKRRPGIANVHGGDLLLPGQLQHFRQASARACCD